MLHNPQVANTVAMEQFLTTESVTLSDEDVDDILRRKAMDEKRVEEQKNFYEIARKRAAELDEYMEQYETGTPDPLFVSVTMLMMHLFADSAATLWSAMVSPCSSRKSRRKKPLRI